MNHPFTGPERGGPGRASRADPGSVRARAYDVVVNGWELGSGSIRIHRADLQERVFRVLGISPRRARQRFGFLLDALRYGAPPHGGIALGPRPHLRDRRRRDVDPRTSSPSRRRPRAST